MKIYKNETELHLGLMRGFLIENGFPVDFLDELTTEELERYYNLALISCNIWSDLKAIDDFSGQYQNFYRQLFFKQIFMFHGKNGIDADWAKEQLKPGKAAIEKMQAIINRLKKIFDDEYSK